MEVKIGIRDIGREVVLESEQSPEDVTGAVEEAVANGGLLRLHDDKGRLVVVPGAVIGYVEIGPAESRRVGRVEGNRSSDSEISTWASCSIRARSSRTGSDPMLWVPNTTSTQGARRVTTARSFCARPPPTAIWMPGRLALTGGRWARLP